MQSRSLLKVSKTLGAQTMHAVDCMTGMSDNWYPVSTCQYGIADEMLGGSLIYGVLLVRFLFGTVLKRIQLPTQLSPETGCLRMLV